MAEREVGLVKFQTTKGVSRDAKLLFLTGTAVDTPTLREPTAEERKREKEHFDGFKARKAMFGANLLVVNHALFFTDLALRRAGAGMLPKYEVVIFDEAHTLEDVAAEHLGLQVRRGSLDYLLNKLYNPRTRKGLLASLPAAYAATQVERTRQAGEQFFNSVMAWVAGQERAVGRGAHHGRGPAHAGDGLQITREAHQRDGVLVEAATQEVVERHAV